LGWDLVKRRGEKTEKTKKEAKTGEVDLRSLSEFQKGSDQQEKKKGV